MHRPFKQEFTHIAPAAFIKRLMAMVYDSLLVIALWMVIGAISVGLNDGEAISIETSSRTTVALFNSALFCATFLFFGFFLDPQWPDAGHACLAAARSDPGRWPSELGAGTGTLHAGDSVTGTVRYRLPVDAADG